MKKLTSFPLAFALCAACAVSAFADTIPGTTTTTTSGATTIKTSIIPTYTVEIPAATKIQFNAAETKLTGRLYLEKAQLEPNHYVRISATANDLTNDADKSKTIPFTLYDGDNRFTSADFRTKYDTVTFSVHIDKTAWETAPAGNYTGSVTFNIEYKSNEG